MAPLVRETFQTSREMDFFSEKELVTQTGHGRDEWPYVILKELVDNGLDACEEAGIAPAIGVKANATGIAVTDNGPGIPQSTLSGICDFSVRCSSREMYVSPDRGAQGNALKTLLAMPFVLDPEHGRFILESRGVRHTLCCSADPIIESSWASIEQGEWRSQLKPQHVIGSLLGWMAAGIPTILAGDHERAGRFVSRIFFLAARRRWRELRCFTEVVTNEHNVDAQH